jgi:hypothetical protein
LVQRWNGYIPSLKSIVQINFCTTAESHDSSTGLVTLPCLKATKVHSIWNHCTDIRVLWIFWRALKVAVTTSLQGSRRRILL